MAQRALDDLYRWKKQQLKLLMEILDLTEQLDQVVSRRDQVSINMVLSMRQDPISQAQELEERAKDYLLALPEEQAIRMNELLSGEPAQSPEEEPLAEQVSQNRRILERIRTLDKKTSLQLGGSHSFYNRFRE